MGALKELTDEERGQVLALRAEHRKWKRAAAKRLHAFADEKEWCGEFEVRAMAPIGLPFRSGFGYGRLASWRMPVEDTAEKFEEWKVKAGRHLYDLAVRHGHETTYGVLIREIGFLGLPRTVIRRVTVTIVHDYTLTLGEDEEIRDPEAWEVQSILRRAPEEEITFKAETIEI